MKKWISAKLALISLMLLALLVPYATAGAADKTLASDRAYTWLKAQQDLTTGFALEGLVDSFDDWWNATDRRQIVYTYDQAVAAIAFMLKNDRTRAEKVLDKMVAIQDPDGSWINSYWWNGYGEEIRKHVGPVAWVVMAYMDYEKMYGSTKYQASAKKALDWIVTFQKSNGAISGGMTTWDANGAWTPEVWSSTEHNEDVYNILKYYAGKFSDRTTTYNNAANSAKSFLDNVVWNDTLKRWNGGWKNNTNTIDPFVPMDVNPWGVLALGLSGTRNYAASLSYVDNSNGNGTSPSSPKYAQTLPYNGTTISAYDFDWQSDCAAAFTQTGAPNGNLCADIWFEGSAFMSVAHYMNGNTAKADTIIDEMIKKQGTSGTLLGGLPYSLQGSNNNYWKMAQENCISSTGWLIIAIARYNPFTGTYLNGTSTPTPTATATPTPTPTSTATPTPTPTSTATPTPTPTPTPVGGDYTVTTTESGNSLTIKFTPGSGVGNPIIHYQSTSLYGGAQQNVTMTSSSGAYTTTISGLSAGNIVKYSFTYQKNGIQQPDTAFTNYTFGGGGSGSTAPSVSSLSPTSGAVGTSVTISGSNFGSSQGSSSVKFGTTTAAVSSWSASSITVTVPSSLSAGSVNVTVTTSAGTSAAKTFTVTTSTVSGDYTVTITKSGNTATVKFTPGTGVTSPIIHYKSTALYGGAQQNVLMTSGSGVYTTTISGLSTGNVVNYSFTYQKNGVQQPETATTSFTF
ncbi:IPT/TIG domain-containing protein [Paenibacillus athensensis]|uniref:CBM56 domain-containing protein n=1 Tax=Paenibacillus athensensis TaxID=1967502 RepID=A0A4Y8Q1P0_9BACL|nr:IPT/TIG domain-containing protein [Paenibacillus athensensis]MCD1260950.1 IPT/TIG domain-containing protein [Paenibacillus athensensis]